MDTRQALIAASCLSINLALAKVAAVLSLPVYLDSIGTIIAAALLPPLAAIIVAVFSSFLGGLIVNPYFAAYVGTQFVIALSALSAMRLGLFRRWWTAIIAGLFIGIIATVVSAPVTVLLFGGVTLSGTTAINAVLLASGRTIWQSVVGGSILVESIDKPTAALMAWLVLGRLPERLHVHRHPASLT